MFDEIFQLVSAANVSTGLCALHKPKKSTIPYKLFTSHIVTFTLPYIDMLGWNIFHIQAQLTFVTAWQASKVLQ